MRCSASLLWFPFLVWFHVPSLPLHLLPLSRHLGVQVLLNSAHVLTGPSSVQRPPPEEPGGHYFSLSFCETRSEVLLDHCLATIERLLTGFPPMCAEELEVGSSPAVGRSRTT